MFPQGGYLSCTLVIYRFLSWNLNWVLTAFMSVPFDPLVPNPIFLTLKIVFLVAITLAHWVSELGALSSDPQLSIFHHNNLCYVQTFLPCPNLIQIFRETKKWCFIPYIPFILFWSVNSHIFAVLV